VGGRKPEGDLAVPLLERRMSKENACSENGNIRGNGKGRGNNRAERTICVAETRRANMHNIGDGTSDRG